MRGPRLNRPPPGPLRAPLAAALLLSAAGGPAGADEVYIAHNQVLVLDGPSRKLVGEAPLDEVVNGIAFSKDGARVFVGTSGGKDLSRSRGGLYVLDAATRRVIGKPLSDPVKELRASPDGKRLHLLEWRVRIEESGPKKRKRPVAEPFRLRTLDIEGPEPRPVGSVMAGVDLYDLAVSPDGKTAYLHDPGHNRLRVMELPGGTLLHAHALDGGRKEDRTYYQAAPAKLVLDGSGARAAVLQSGEARSGLLLVELDGRSRRQVVFPQGQNFRAGRFLPDGKRMLAVSIERLLVLDLEAGAIQRSVPLKGTFTSLCISADGKEVYLGAPVDLSRKGGLVEVRDGDSLGLLAQVPVPITVKLLAPAPPRPPAER